jgi:hypothetical protein
MDCHICITKVRNDKNETNDMVALHAMQYGMGPIEYNTTQN